MGQPLRQQALGAGWGGGGSEGAGVCMVLIIIVYPAPAYYGNATYPIKRTAPRQSLIDNKSIIRLQLNIVPIWQFLLLFGFIEP